ncbi:MAG: hypothetical protein COT74_08310 [Bdellovibrionales bacterium CG10_big_fil_rev_8_21_14_0_10_45_34]|nr:MAG: hypothetical protein COT74_08310 [Bdellovibrionales bacterium CG10_big_fil_rev_8_21_14_0_10_45_34]
MKSFSCGLIALVVAFASSAQAQSFETKEQNKIPDHAFVPVGFDSNDNSQIVISGFYPNGCHKMGPTFFTVDKTNKKIVIEDKELFASGAICTMQIQPYKKVINIGLLNAGDYTITAKGENEEEVVKNNINVSLAQPNAPQDAELYADVYDLESKLTDDGATELKIRGFLTNTCMKLDRVRAEIQDGNVLLIVPTVTLEGQDCERTEIRFSKVVKARLSDKLHLVHVRANNGQSLNEIIQNGSIVHTY